MKIIFVCTGNTCRSPMAQWYLNSKHIPFLKAESRGLCASGETISENSRTVMKESGIDIDNHISSNLTSDDINRADMIVCLTESHKAALENAGVPSKMLYVLGRGISDPFGQDTAVYRKCRDEIFSAVDALIYQNGITPFNIQKAEEIDIPKIAELERICFSEPWSENAIKESMNARTVFFTAKSHGNLCGYAGLSVAADEGYITNIAVFPEYREKGAAALLISRMADYAQSRKLAFISLEVRASNKKAISLYENSAFRKAGIRKNFYVFPKEDAIIMTRRFTHQNENSEH